MTPLALANANYANVKGTVKGNTRTDCAAAAAAALAAAAAAAAAFRVTVAEAAGIASEDVQGRHWPGHRDGPEIKNLSLTRRGSREGDIGGCLRPGQEQSA